MFTPSQVVPLKDLSAIAKFTVSDCVATGVTWLAEMQITHTTRMFMSVLKYAKNDNVKSYHSYLRLEFQSTPTIHIGYWGGQCSPMKISGEFKDPLGVSDFEFKSKR